MTFKRINFQGVESSAGFVVQIAGRFELQYIEHDHVLSVPIENSLVVIIYCDRSCRWNPPFEEEEISETKRREILQNIEAALNFMGDRCVFVSG
jgi:hypothetical protein